MGEDVEKPDREHSLARRRRDHAEFGAVGRVDMSVDGGPLGGADEFLEFADAGGEEELTVGGEALLFIRGETGIPSAGVLPGLVIVVEVADDLFGDVTCASKVGLAVFTIAALSRSSTNC